MTKIDEPSPFAHEPPTPIDRALTVAKRIPRFWKIGLAVAIVGCGASVYAPKVVKPVYRSETVLVYREGIQASANPQQTAENQRRLGARLKDMLLARTRLEKIIGEFNLYPKTVARDGIIDGVEQLRKHIDFKAREGDTFHITFDGDDPETVQKVVSRLADGLVEENSRLKVQQASETKAFLDEEKKHNDDELKQRERALAFFLSVHPEFADEAGGKGGPSAGSAVRAAEKKERDMKAGIGGGGNATLWALERQANRLRAQLRNPSAPPPAPMVHSAPVDPKLQQAKQDADAQLASAQRELSDKQARFTDQHPDVVAARAKVAAAQQKAFAAARAITDAQAQVVAEPYPPPAPEEQRADLEAQLGKIEREIGALRSAQKGGSSQPTTTKDEEAAATGIVALETEWTRLNRDVLEARETGQQLVDRLFRASIAANVESSGGADQMVVVDPAYRPNRPFSFGKVRVTAVSMAISVLLGLVAAILRAVFDGRVYGEIDVERLGIAKLALFVPAVPATQGGKRG